MGVGGAFAAELRQQRFGQGLADRQSLPGQAPLQQVQRGVELVAFVGFLFDGIGCGADEGVDRVHQTFEPRQPSRVGNARAAEERDAAFLVRLQQRIGNLRAVS